MIQGFFDGIKSLLKGVQDLAAFSVAMVVGCFRPPNEMRDIKDETDLAGGG